MQNSSGFQEPELDPDPDADPDAENVDDLDSLSFSTSTGDSGKPLLPLHGTAGRIYRHPSEPTFWQFDIPQENIDAIYRDLINRERMVMVQGDLLSMVIGLVGRVQGILAQMQNTDNTQMFSYVEKIGSLRSVTLIRQLDPITSIQTAPITADLLAWVHNRHFLFELDIQQMVNQFNEIAYRERQLYLAPYASGVQTCDINLADASFSVTYDTMTLVDSGTVRGHGLSVNGTADQPQPVVMVRVLIGLQQANRKSAHRDGPELVQRRVLKKRRTAHEQSLHIEARLAKLEVRQKSPPWASIHYRTLMRIFKDYRAECPNLRPLSSWMCANILLEAITMTISRRPLVSSFNSSTDRRQHIDRVRRWALVDAYCNALFLLADGILLPHTRYYDKLTGKPFSTLLTSDEAHNLTNESGHIWRRVQCQRLRISITTTSSLGSSASSPLNTPTASSSSSGGGQVVGFTIYDKHKLNSHRTNIPLEQFYPPPNRSICAATAHPRRPRYSFSGICRSGNDNSGGTASGSGSQVNRPKRQHHSFT